MGRGLSELPRMGLAPLQARRSLSGLRVMVVAQMPD